MKSHPRRLILFCIEQPPSPPPELSDHPRSRRMAVTRCPGCQLPLTEEEARTGACPVCATALVADAPPAAAPQPAPARKRSRATPVLALTALALAVAAACVYFL